VPPPPLAAAVATLLHGRAKNPEHTASRSGAGIEIGAGRRLCWEPVHVVGGDGASL
jgi:hypothetical protein